MKLFSNTITINLVTSVTTVISTALGIFIGNRLLDFSKKTKDRREKALLFIASIELHIHSLICIYPLIYSGNIKHARQDIDIYQADINDNEMFTLSLKSIGIYEENTIGLISSYYSQLTRCSQYIQKLLIRTENNQNIYFVFVIVKVTLAITTLEGILCLYVLKCKYSSKNKEVIENEFIEHYDKVLYELRRNCAEPSISNGYFPVIDIKTGKSLVRKLKYIKEKMAEHKKCQKIFFGKQNLHICLGSTKSEYRARIDMVYRKQIDSNSCILTFANSEEESISICKRFINDALVNYTGQEKERVIQTFKFETESIYPLNL